VSRLIFGLASLCLALPLAPSGRGAELSTKVVDGLGRPVSAADVELAYFRLNAGRASDHISLLKVKTDEKGLARGVYDEKASPNPSYLYVKVGKDGYAGYSSTALHDPVYVLKRIFPAAVFDRLVDLEESARTRQLKELLAGALETGDLDERLFFREDRLRPSLRLLVLDQQVRMGAIAGLVLIGVPEDLDWIAQHLPPLTENFWENHWANEVVAVMLAPSSAEAWSFLADCAIGERYRGIASADAIESLKFIASARSRQILAEARTKNRVQRSIILDAIAYIDSKPQPLEGRDLPALTQRVGVLIGGDLPREAERPRFNSLGNKARVRMSFVDGRDAYGYSATFHREDGIWKFRGAREAGHGLLSVK
jgi:hypothetical protein